jgi:hypothetical protein
MTAASPSVSDNARKIESAVLRALAERTQRNAAEAAGLSESRVSRFKGEGADGGLHLPEVAALLAALGLCVIDGDAKELATLPRDEYEALRVLARRALA